MKIEAGVVAHGRGPLPTLIPIFIREWRVPVHNYSALHKVSQVATPNLNICINTEIRKYGKLSFVSFYFSPLKEEDARSIAEWRYDDPYSFYNADPRNLEEDVQWFLNPQNAYYSIVAEQGELMGFFCLGADAQVPGGDYSDSSAIDVGLGLRPDLTGQGMGLNVINAVLEHVKSQSAPSRFRATVATFNRRAIRLCERAGFQPKDTFTSKTTKNDEREFMVLTREV